MRDGTVHEGVLGEALGHPERPLSRDKLIAKFIDCAGRAARPLPVAAATALAGRLLAIDEAADAGALFASSHAAG